MNSTIEYLRLVRDALTERSRVAGDNEDYELVNALEHASSKAEGLICALRELERFA